MTENQVLAVQELLASLEYIAAGRADSLHQARWIAMGALLRATVIIQESRVPSIEETIASLTAMLSPADEETSVPKKESVN